MKSTDDDLEGFSQDGLRTLILASKDLTREEYEQFAKVYSHAANLIIDREEKVESVCSEMEKDLYIVGATAIEDKLQEQVPETIDYLLQAGIKVWVITGDKQATAINIGYSTKLLTKDMKVVKVNANSANALEAMLSQNIAECGGSDQPYQWVPMSSSEELIKGDGVEVAMVIDGTTLQFGLEHCPELLLRFAQMCKSVVCCRVAPLQKVRVNSLFASHDHHQLSVVVAVVV